MTSTSVSSVRHGKAAERDGFLTPALYVSIAIAIFAVVTQLLAATGAASLSTTQQLTMWLVAAGLIVLLWIAYMICRAYVTARAEKAEAEQARAAALDANEQRTEALAAKAAAEQEAKAAREQLAQARQDAEQQKDRVEKAEAKAEQAHAAALDANEQRTEALAAKARVEQELKDALEKIAKLLLVLEQPPGHPAGQREAGSAGADDDGWVPPAGLRYLDGSEHSVSTAKVFPDGCYLEPDPIRPVVDELTGQQVYQCRVLDLNGALKDRPHETVVKILADQEPSLPSMPRFFPVGFDELKITAYVIDRSQMRIRYALRATGIHPAAATAEERVQATWTAAPDSSETVASGKAEAHGTSVGTGILKAAGAHVAKEVARDIVTNVLLGG